MTVKMYLKFCQLSFPGSHEESVLPRFCGVLGDDELTISAGKQLRMGSMLFVASGML